jgi:hypothetical protein
MYTYTRTEFEYIHDAKVVICFLKVKGPSSREFQFLYEKFPNAFQKLRRVRSLALVRFLVAQNREIVKSVYQSGVIRVP